MAQDMSRPTTDEAAKALANLLRSLDAGGDSTAGNAATGLNADLARALQELAGQHPQHASTEPQAPARELWPNAAASGFSSARRQQQQPTRSGRVPKLPDPAALPDDPLAYLDLPSESESDDPDFRPDETTPKQAGARAQHLDGDRGMEADGDTAGGSPWDGTGTESEAGWGGGESFSVAGWDELPTLTGAGLDATRSSDLSGVFPDLDLGNLSELVGSGSGENPGWLGIGLASPPAEPRQVSSQQSSPCLGTAPNQAVRDEPSPLTVAGLEGIPFIHVALPESDDSPEFVPPPKRQRISSRSPGSEVSVRSRTSDTARPPNTAQAQQRPEPSASISTTKEAMFPSPSAPTAAAHAGGRAKAAHEAREAEQLHAAIGRPAREAAETWQPASRWDDPRHSGPKDAQGRPLLTKKGKIRKAPGPKPKSAKAAGQEEEEKEDQERFLISALGTDEEKKAQLNKRKREALRESRERRAHYMEDLEARVVRLEEENDRLRRENEQLMRESREHWRQRALGQAAAAAAGAETLPLEAAASPSAGPSPLGGGCIANSVGGSSINTGGTLHDDDAFIASLGMASFDGSRWM